jgi:tetratricopeptide (TPR) repeat protein
MDAMKELLEWAANRRALLILDNVEDCTQAAEIAAKIVEVSANIVLVFTSYTRLDLMGERVYALKGLSVREGSGSEAVSLFLSHLQQESQPESGSHEFLENVVHICSLVEGLPLAIDLAAGQVKRLASSNLLNELSASMDILHSKAANLPERHRSITASFENSWHHLSPEQQRTLSTLTVFQAPFTLEAAASVCGVASTDVRDLTDQSLILWDGGDYYRFHRAVYQYAREKQTIEAAAVDSLRGRHAKYFCQGLLKDYGNYSREGVLQFLTNFGSVAPDIEKSIRYLIEGKDWDCVMKMIHPIYAYCEARSLYRYGSLLMQDFASRCGKDENGQRCRARLSARAASLLISIQQYSEVQGMIDLSLENARAVNDESEESFCLNVLAKQAAVRKSSSTSFEYASSALEKALSAGDKREVVHSLYNQGYALINLGEITRAEQALNDCRKDCDELGDWRRLSKVLNVMADAACYRGDFDRALEFYTESYALAEKLENRYSQSLVLNNMGTVYFSQKNYEKAAENYKKSLEVCRDIDDREGEAIALSNLGELFADKGEFEKGADYNRKALAICEEIGSDWGEMSARVVLATCYRELGKKKAAQDEVTVVLRRSLESEFFYFFSRAVIEGCQLLLERGKMMGIAQIILEIAKDEDSDEWVRNKARAILDHIPDDGDGETITTDRHSIMEFLMENLQKE